MWFRHSTRAVLACASLLCVRAQSNFDTDHSTLNLESIGRIEWSPSLENGAVINQYYASGYIYAVNTGWISLGSIPVDQLRYHNTSAEDFGVNVTSDGALRGFAYGANVGWINFEPLGNPHIDWISGKISGRAWAANLGWLDLETSSEFLRLASLPEPVDSDGDGMADAWEMAHASNLTTFSSESDADEDGSSDLDEYSAGTGPLDAEDSLRLQVRGSASPGSCLLQWTTRPGYIYFIDGRSALQPSAEWTPASERVVGTGAAASLSIPPNNSHNFYRVRAYPPLSAP